MNVVPISPLALLEKGGWAVWKFRGVIFLLATDLASERLASEVPPPPPLLTRLPSRVCFYKVRARACHECLLLPCKEWSGDIPFILWVCNLAPVAYVTCRTLQNILTSVGRAAYQAGVLISFVYAVYPRAERCLLGVVSMKIIREYMTVSCFAGYRIQI
jgi:hypothetical protein